LGEWIAFVDQVMDLLKSSWQTIMSY
jgi:hypothetical protein